MVALIKSKSLIGLLAKLFVWKIKQVWEKDSTRKRKKKTSDKEQAKLERLINMLIAQSNNWIAICQRCVQIKPYWTKNYSNNE